MQLRILIVEDEYIIAKDLKLKLETMGHQVVGIARDGNTALIKTGETNPDIVLMDIVLTGDQDGIETAQKIRDNYGIPFIYLTSYYDDGILERAAKTQPYGYLTKPYHDIGLNTAILMAIYKYKNEPQVNNIENIKQTSRVSRIINKIFKPLRY